MYNSVMFSRSFLTFVAVFLLSLIPLPLILDSASEKIDVKPKLVLSCLKEMEQELNISDLPVVSQKSTIIQGVRCLKSIDSPEKDYQNILFLSQEIIDHPALEKELKNDLLDKIHSAIERTIQKQNMSIFKEVIIYYIALTLGYLFIGKRLSEKI